MSGLYRRTRKNAQIRLDEVVSINPRRRSKYRHGSQIVVRRPDFMDADPRAAILNWLTDHRDYDGDDCLIFPWARPGDNKPRCIMFNYRRMAAARAMCLLAHGRPPADDALSLHSCGNGHLSCVNQKHLRWGSHEENMKDMVLHGSLKGEKAPNAKLTDAQVVELWRDLKRGVPSDILAGRYCVTNAAINAIKSGRSWAWLTLAGGRDEFRKQEAEEISRRKSADGIIEAQRDAPLRLNKLLLRLPKSLKSH